jgi:hypothetical protein
MVKVKKRDMATFWATTLLLALVRFCTTFFIRKTSKYGLDPDLDMEPEPE